ncbi:alpha/beta hydrolase family protein [Hymenobacter sp. 102]|uniref:alpha/beta hydrolase family protein n=1 Tax=Hymenobacter sp. 102 TaxID=3403152 RepID=UPI003CE946DF
MPVILFSHGNGSSADAYGPLVHGWAAQGFVVIQPTHLDSRTLGLASTDPRRSLLWRLRAEDLLGILDQLDQVMAAVPHLQGRLDPQRIAVAGHSWGAQTAGMLLGAQLPDPVSGQTVNLADARIRAGVLLAAPGRGGADLTPATAAQFPFLHPDFAPMTTPTLVVVGDRDVSRMTTRGYDWRADAYALSSGPGCLLTLFGAEHSLGGIPGYESRETTDEHPARVALLQHLTGAYLRSALYPEDPAWPRACAALHAEAEPLGRVDCR